MNCPRCHQPILIENVEFIFDINICHKCFDEINKLMIDKKTEQCEFCEYNCDNCHPVCVECEADID